MEKIVSIIVIFFAAVLLLAGCDKKKDNDNTTLALFLLLPRNSTTGTQENIEAGSTATSAVASAASAAQQAAMGSEMMNPSVLSGKASVTCAKETIQKMMLDSVIKKTIKPGDKKADTITLNVHFTDAITTPTYKFEPDIYLRGTVTDDGTGTLSEMNITMDVTMTGTIDVTFTNASIIVFDVYSFIQNNVIDFKTVTLDGSFTSNVDSSVATTVTMSSSESGSIITMTSAGETKENSKSTTISDGLTIDDVDYTFDITSKANNDWSWDSTVRMNKTTYESSSKYDSLTGSWSQSVSGTVNGSRFSYSWVLKGDDLKAYLEY